MPRFKDTEIRQGRFISVQFDHQILPGTFEYALNYIVDRKLDMSVFHAHYRNDEKGAAAYDPRALLKIILFAYSRGMVSSRDIEAACKQNVVFMALSGDTQPHFTTIAGFIADMPDVIGPLFRDVLLYCDELGLIGKEMFAIDGCKISSNASKEWSGTRQDFERKKQKFEESIRFLIRKHQAEDAEERKNPAPPGPKNPGPRRDKEERAIEHLREKVAKIDEWLSTREDKMGVQGKPVQSNVTDPDSAKLTSSHGVIQGYDGLAVVDAKHQIIVTAEAFGSGSEAGLLEPVIDKVKETFESLGQPDVLERAVVTADSGFHSEANMKMLSDKQIDGYVADRYMRQRDPAFQTAKRHKTSVREGTKKSQRKYFGPDDFVFNESGDLVCPAGRAMWLKDKEVKTANGFIGSCYMAHVKDCRGCELRAKCLRVATTEARQVYKFHAREIPAPKESFTKRMIQKVDSLAGRYLYSRRMGTVEPVFGHIRAALGLNRFTLRGKPKVNGQWNLYAMVHNLMKVQRIGWAGAG